jgi:hypothetical protein
MILLFLFFLVFFLFVFGFVGKVVEKNIHLKAFSFSSAFVHQSIERR